MGVPLQHHEGRNVMFILVFVGGLLGVAGIGYAMYRFCESHWDDT